MKKPKPAPPKSGSDATMAAFDRLAKVLAGESSDVQGSTLAMALGRWLWGHRVLERDGSISIEATRDIRSRLMIMHTKMAFSFCKADDDHFSKEAEGGGRKGRN